MNEGYSRNDIILQRLNKAKECLAEAKWAVEGGFNNAAVNRLYYSCFNAVNALLFFRNINAKSHAGVRSQFGMHFIEPLIFPKEMGKLYSNLFESRQESDYEDFFVIENDALNDLMSGAENFITAIENYLTEKF